MLKINEEKLARFKKTYLDIKTPDYLEKQGFEDLKIRLSEQDKPRLNIYKYGFLFASVLIVITAGTVSASQSAKEGDFLYPVRAISEPVLKSVRQSISQDTQKKQEILPSIATPSPTTNPENKNENEEKENKGDENKKSFEEVKESYKNKELEENNAANKKRTDDVKGASTQSENKKSEEDKGGENDKPEDGNEKKNDNSNYRSVEKEKSGESKNKNEN